MYRVIGVLAACRAKGLGPLALQSPKRWCNTKRKKQDEGTTGQKEKGSAFFRDHARQHHKCTVNQPRRRTEEELQTQFQQAKELLEYARSELSQNPERLNRAQKKLISKVLGKRDAALNTRIERKCDDATRQATQRRDIALMPSKDEEKWLKSTFRDVEIGRTDDAAEDEAGKNWEKMSSLLKLGMDAYKFNKLAISSNTREILRIMFRNIVARKLHQIKMGNHAEE
ncbi:hypothetical protein FA10DRAFT_258717 [Acaromyces ingoldii]|uniref:Uncharacterized protein n=1 Tax=Acaromyces ingoldii TaxID=215250 RepID=A0A316YP42_9BASI|nr:hypothetical protein FA10DRAFT_258717 [Acaromyces ingoldii]PWN91310.1 hypothetical protein FA10DRAFT_258717 [Acaromyces ingoldii]